MFIEHERLNSSLKGTKVLQRLKKDYSTVKELFAKTGPHVQGSINEFYNFFFFLPLPK